MKWCCLTPATALALWGCAEAPRNLDAELDADLATGQVLLSCKASSSGTCYAIFLDESGSVSAQAATGSTASASGVGEGVEYCVDVDMPDRAKCRPKPLVPGKQIIHLATVKSN